MRTLAGGKQSLYLDIYTDGRRTYEFLKLYLVPERTREDREKNRETMRLAEAVKSQRLVDIQNNRFGFESAYKLDTEFLPYYRAMCQERFNMEGSRGNWGNWWSCLQHLERYCRKTPHITFREIDKEWLQGFKDYLDTTARCRDKRKTITTSYDSKPLSQNSKHSYFNKVVACINHAFEDGVIPTNPARGVERFKQGDVNKCYLTLEEVKAMAAAECKYPVLKRAFLFSCLTGLRKSDIEKMKWSEVHQQGDLTRIIFTQQKTGSLEYLDISPEAVKYLGERGKPDQRVFAGFKYSSYLITELRMWAIRAGVLKDITFHSGRHTFAVLMLDLGADIYTVQKLLGHKELRTTEIYAKLLDKKKQAAVLLIPKLDV